MSQELEKAIKAVNKNEFSFCKFVSPNDAGDTGAHQAGLYIPKNSIDLMFDEPGQKGKNKEKYATINWWDGVQSQCRFIYYGQGSRNEYRITRLGRHFKVGELIVIVKLSDLEYEGFVLSGKKNIKDFLIEFNLTEEQTNSLIPKKDRPVQFFSETEQSFKPKARLILQLGDQLIRSENIALLEIIKNAYDADASLVNISMTQLDNSDYASIVIEDDGSGMDAELIRNVWLQPGSDYKTKQIKGKSRSPKFNRLPLGEKGIGRFGVHKLGNEIELISKKAGKKEVYVKIDWKAFEKDDLLENIPIKIIERDSQYFDETETGTRIIIRNLKNTWSRGTIRDLHRSINSLNSPFETKEAFQVLFRLDKQEWLSGLATFQDIRESALFYAEVTLKNNLIKSLAYQFKPWESMTKIESREIEYTNIRMTHKVYDEIAGKKTQKDIDLNAKGFLIGEVKLKLLIFDQDSKILSLGVQDKSGLKEYLKLNGGVRVYRDGMRVYDYGEPGNDWLNLDSERVNQPTVKLSNNIVIGAIELDRIESASLIEKTNREGFVENEAYQTFNDAIRYVISQISVERNIDKEKLRTFYGIASQSEPVIGNLEILKDKITTYVPDGKNQTDILNSIKEIERDYKQISEIYIRSASAGLSLSIVIHEIEKIISELTKVVEEDKSSLRITSLTKHLSKLIDGYTGVIRFKAKKKNDLRNVIDQAIFNIEFRLKAHAVGIVDKYLEPAKKEIYAKCSDSMILGIIINIIDNSIWWLNYGNIKEKKIFVDISDHHTGYTSIVIADNGPGFTLPTEAIVKPFITNKAGGIGIGLHIAYEIMNSHGGELLFGVNNFEIPKEFENGAIVALAFKNQN